MLKKFVWAVVLAAVILTSLAAGVAWETSHNSPAPGSKAASGGVVTKTGVIVCLPPVDTAGPVELVCALGLKADDGAYYGLGSNDPMLVGTVPTGRTVRVTGRLVPTSNAKYQTSGSIQVKTLKQL